VTKAVPPHAPRMTKRRRRIVFVTILAIVLLLVVDQMGVRELSGRDFPVTDPLAESLRTHVVELAKPSWNGRVPGTEGNTAAARYLEDALKAAGAGPFPSVGGYLMPLPDSRLGHNVVSWIPPDDPDTSRGVIVLGAHFDHVGPTPEGVLLGADDNASAVAVILGAIPLILQMKPRPYGIAVVLFNTEEAPYFGTSRQGSRAFLSALPREIDSAKSIRLAIAMDLVGGVVWRRTADSIYACGAEKTTGLPAVVDAVHEDKLDVRRLGIHTVENIPGYRPNAFSDYDVFRDNHIPFLFLSSGRTPRYHHPSDVPDTLYYDRMARTSRWIHKLVERFSHSTDTFVFQPNAEDYAADRDSLRWAFDAAVKPWSSISGTSPMSAVQLLRDRSRLEALADPLHVWTAADALAIERASFRLQCLLYRYPICFTL
jgi:Peptidase family M28